MKEEILPKDNSIENFWNQNIDLVKTEPMSKDITKYLMTLIISSNISESELEKDFIYKIITKRCKVLLLNLSPKVKALLSILCDGNPGNSTIYLSYLRFKLKGFGNEVTISKICESIFPWGFLTDESLNNIWKAQKLDNHNNLFDYFDSYKSLYKDFTITEKSNISILNN